MPDSNPDRPRSQWMESLHEKIEKLRLTVEENTRAIAAQSARINSAFLVVLAMSAMGAATWALFAGKINEHSWLGVLFACLAEFFGKGVRNVIEGFLPWSKRGQEAKTAATLVFVILGAGLAVGGAVHSSAQDYDAAQREIVPKVDREDRVDFHRGRIYGI